MVYTIKKTESGVLKMDRKIVLLKACMELLQKQEQSETVLNLLDEAVQYDNAECDGSWLLGDIKELLKEYEESNKE